MTSSLPTPQGQPSPSRPVPLTRFVIAGLLSAGLVLVGRQGASALPGFVDWIASLGALGPVVFVAGYALAVVAFVPASVLTLAAGAVFGLTTGVACVFVASTTGAMLSFLLARYVARDAVEKWVDNDARFAAIDRAVASEGRKIVFLLRLSPAFPFTILNYALGLTRVRFADFAIASAGTLPGTFLYVYYGKLAGEVAALAGAKTIDKGPEYYALLAVGLVATIAVTAVVTRTARRALATATANTEVAPGAGPAAANPPAASHSAGSTTPTHPPVHPLDEANQRLLDNVRPSSWTNPTPAPCCNLVVVGAGTGGLVTAAIGASLGGKVALVERSLMGGDCLNYGCVPSKALIHRARDLAGAAGGRSRTAITEEELDDRFAAAMLHMREARATISHDDSALRFRDELGVDVFQGMARFTGPDTLEVNGQPLRFKKAVIATGARAAIPEVPGLAEAGYLTNETVFNLTERPRRLVVLGGGPIGCELAQTMRRFGCEVAIVERADQLIIREDRDAAAILEEVLRREGVRLVLGAELHAVEGGPEGKTLRYSVAGASEGLVVDEILVAAGRRPNVEGLGLEEAGVAFHSRGIQVDDNLRTTNARVYAVGDCCMRWQFTHAADAAAKIVVQNALFLGRKKLSDLTMPWCTYTDPEIAHVGEYEAEARQRGIAVDTFLVPLEKVNRAVCDEETDGFVKVHTQKGTDKILGATIVASHAGEMISELTLAMTNGIGLAKIAAVIHPYPTQAEGIKAAANAYMRTRLTPRAKGLLAGWLRFARS